MADKTLTSTEVVYALIAASATGPKLSVYGDNPVVITGPDEDRERAREVLEAQGWTLARSPGRDEWTRS